ncbi:helix-turn-helix transcriptional regulator [Dokdonia sp.]|uniref:helix-turn-helix domain-containing protein n=1 Tax=Dokdonia sp. TaxID=2024995 RepID=UPI003265122C
MVNDFFKQVLKETPKDIEVFVSKYEAITMRIYEILKAKNLSQKDLAEKLNKRPSEISKWLNDGHNLTLKTLSKLEAVLEEEIINIPLKQSFVGKNNDVNTFSGVTTFFVYKNDKKESIKYQECNFIEMKPKLSKRIA